MGHGGWGPRGRDVPLQILKASYIIRGGFKLIGSRKVVGGKEYGREGIDYEGGGR